MGFLKNRLRLSVDPHMHLKHSKPTNITVEKTKNEGARCCWRSSQRNMLLSTSQSPSNPKHLSTVYLN